MRTANLAFEARLPGHTGQLQPGTGSRPILSYGPWYQGRYDAISIFEAPDDAAVAKVLLAIAGFGNVRTETMRAFDEAETSAIVGSL